MAEINNTPWNERHAYLIYPYEEKQATTFEKDFHVSPFMSMDQSYEWQFSKPENELKVHMKNFESSKLMFFAHLNLKREELTSSSMFKVLFLYPFITFKVIALIYLHAAFLKLKGIPFFRSSKNPNLMNIPQRQIQRPAPQRTILPFRKIIHSYFKQCKQGGLFLVEGNEHHFFGDPEAKEVSTMTIHHPSAYRYFFWSGSLGAAEAYGKGLWESSDLTQCLQFFTKNIGVVSDIESNQNWYMKPFAKAMEWFKKTT